MADYVLTSANVLMGTNGRDSAPVIAGETIAAGKAISIKSSDGKAYLADANSATVNACHGIARNGAAAGQPVSYVTEDDDFTHGLTGVAAGDIICLSATPGALCPPEDLAAGDYPNVVMIAKTAAKAVLKILRGGVAIPGQA